jgi:endonuclease VIII
MSLHFANGTLNFYVSKILMIDGSPDETYDWSVDIMHDKWNPAKALKTMQEKPDRMICDVLFDQQIFSGVGNIIKNEMLFKAKLHPESKVGSTPPAILKSLVNSLKKYSYQFLEWKSAGVFAKHWKIYQQETCPRCDLPVHKKDTGKNKRTTYFCTNCQIKYTKKLAKEK